MGSTAKEIEEFEDPENWDFDAVQIQPPVKDPHAIVSVKFNRNEFDQIAVEARRRGVTLTTFIKEAALQFSDPSPAGSHNQADGVGNGMVISDSDPVQSQARLKD